MRSGETEVAMICCSVLLASFYFKISVIKCGRTQVHASTRTTEKSEKSELPGSEDWDVRWLVRAIKSTSLFFTSTVSNCPSTVINWPSTLITVEGDNCRSTLITVDRHLELGTGPQRCNVQRWRSLNERKICVFNFINISIC